VKILILKKRSSSPVLFINKAIINLLYDIHNEHFDEKNFKPSSTEPVVRIQGIKQENNESDSSSSDGDGSDDSNLYYEFDSDEADSASHTTKSTTTINKQ